MLAYTEVRSILEEVECPPYQITLFRLRDHEDVWYLQVRKRRKDIDTGEYGWGYGAKYFISPHSTPEEIRQRALKACIDFSEHETREAFLWKGRRIFGPHLDHQRLWEAAEDTVKREKQ